jgi:ABC-type transport system involved in multi-copper enzyme maturation permease subunit
MNYSMVGRLIWKDWYFQRRAILLSLAGGAVSLLIVAFGGQPGFTIGLIFLVSILAIISATTVMGNVLGERENQTLAFAMSLPISYLEYTTSKIVGALLIFVPLWLAMVAGCLGLILAAPAIHGLFAFTVIMAVEMLVSNCLLIAVVLVTESKGWSTSAIVSGNVSISLVGYIVAHVPGIKNGMWGTTILWTPAATILLLVEFALIALILGMAFFLQSRKKDFL